MKSPRAERIEPSTTNVHDREMAQPPSVATSKPPYTWASRTHPPRITTPSSIPEDLGVRSVGTRDPAEAAREVHEHFRAMGV
jgi:hypothetical protein